MHRLDATHITGCGEKWFLAIGRRPLLLPPPLARMLRGLADQPRRGAPVFSRAALPVPHRGVHAPISAGTLTKKLNAHGIAVRAERNSAMLALASTCPARSSPKRRGTHRHRPALEPARRAGLEPLPARTQRAGHNGTAAR
jgi:hypothetical protein